MADKKYPISLLEISKVLKEKEIFLIKYSHCPYANILYKDILSLLHEILTKKASFDYAIRILYVYYVLLHEQKEITVRELFYRCKRIFIQQKYLSTSLRHIRTRIKIDLNIVASYKGLLNGECTVKRDGHLIHLRDTSLIPHTKPLDELVTAAKLIIVVEKEAAFIDILQDKEKIERKLGVKILIVTGKGYPCTNTLLFLKMAKNIRTFGLFDCDPHGLCIYAVYKYGSKKRPYLKVSGIQKIGVFLQDLPSLKGLSQITQKKQYSMMENLAVQYKDIEQDAKMLIKIGKKAGIEDISQIQPLEAYLTKKLQEAMHLLKM